jgi:putative zinc finger/helix-turn-helix YgiT family protein
VTDRLECLECGKLVAPIVEEREETLPVRGEPTTVLARVAVCPACGADMSVQKLDDATLVAAFNLYRQHHGLMTPKEMKSLRKQYGLGVRPFSLLLGWGEITLHRYESGSLQDGAHEAALRMAEDPANVRVYLTANGHKLTARQRAGLEVHLQAAEAAHAACALRPGDRFVAHEEPDEYGGGVPAQVSMTGEMMRSDPRTYLAVAQEHLESARLAARGGRWNSAGLAAIHAGINAVDAATMASAGVRNASQDHGAAVDLMRTTVPEVSVAQERQLAGLLSMKNTVEREPRLLTAAEARPMVEQAIRLVKWAATVVSGHLD